jgi:hypothetical protein
MEPMYYIGLDAHKRKISYCVKDRSDQLHAEGSLPATRFDLEHRTTYSAVARPASLRHQSGVSLH